MTHESRKTENEKTARLAGTGAGVVAGAQLGTVLLPIPVVGTFAGALVGGVIGSKIGKRVGGVILDNTSCLDTPTTHAHASGKSEVIAEVERLAKLRDQGILSEEEFKAAKARLFGL